GQSGGLACGHPPLDKTGPPIEPNRQGKAPRELRAQFAGRVSLSSIVSSSERRRPFGDRPDIGRLIQRLVDPACLNHHYFLTLSSRAAAMTKHPRHGTVPQAP